MTEYETMTYHRQGRIGYIALNRPQALNAVNDQFELDIAEALLEFDMDEEAWVAIIHGEGRAFCAGADIKQRFMEMTRARARFAAGAPAPKATWPAPSTGSLLSPPSTVTAWAPASPWPASAT